MYIKDLQTNQSVYVSPPASRRPALLELLKALPDMWANNKTIDSCGGAAIEVRMGAVSCASWAGPLAAWAGARAAWAGAWAACACERDGRASAGWCVILPSLFCVPCHVRC